MTMSCYFESQEGKGEIRAVMTFYREELLHDIRMAGYAEGSTVDGEMNDHRRHLVQDIAEDVNIDRLDRALDLAVAKAREALYAYTKRPVDRPETDNRLSEHKLYGFVLQLPEDFSQTTLDLLTKLTQEYIVSSAVADWFSTVYPERAEVWASRAEAASRRILTAGGKRRGRLRRTMRPF